MKHITIGQNDTQQIYPNWRNLQLYLSVSWIYKNFVTKKNHIESYALDSIVMQCSHGPKIKPIPKQTYERKYGNNNKD